MCIKKGGIMAQLLILKATAGDLRGQEFAFPGPAHVLLGRSRTCWLRLPGDATVSRQHCLIEVDEAGAWVQDLGSLNGTYINGAKIGQRARERQDDATMLQPPRQSLQEGDELRICNNAFVIEIVEAVEGKETALGKEPGRSSDQWMLAGCN
jgi:pSer/pThr/pTyr-binding forkhead associated (FHA) protein